MKKEVGEATLLTILLKWVLLKGLFFLVIHLKPPLIPHIFVRRDVTWAFKQEGKLPQGSSFLRYFSIGDST